MLQKTASVIAQFASDVRYGLRLLRKTPAFTTTTILILAIGIGANTALFSIADRVVLRPLPYPDSERLLILWSKPAGGGIMPVSPANYLDLKARNHVFKRLSALNMAVFTASIDGAAERLNGFRVTADFFETLGVQPSLGRPFAAGDDKAGAARVAILSYGAWQARFAGDPRILGRPLTLDGEPYTVVGVMSSSFRFAMSPEVWVPLPVDSAKASRDMPMLLPLGRLAPGVPLAAARVELEGLAAGLATEHPSLKGWGIDVRTLHDYLAQYGRNDVFLLFGAVALVLLIACVNVANLLLARSAARRRELAVRASVGASRGRLIVQLLTEGVLLAMMGGAAGVIFSLWLSGLASSFLPAFVLEAMPEIAIDFRVLLFTLALSVFTGLLFGAAPAWRASKIDISETLKQATGIGSARSRWLDLRTVLVVAQVAITVILLAGAGLLARTLGAMYAVDPGFIPDNVLTMRITVDKNRYQSPEQIRAYQRSLLERLGGVQAIHSVALTSHLPMQSMALNVPFQVVSGSGPAAERQQGTVQYMSEGYFETFRTRLRAGRLFGDRDNERAPRVVIVNEAFAKRYLRSDQPLETQLTMDEQWMGGAKNAPARPWEIVGVIADVKLGDFASAAMPQIYVPLAQCSLPADMIALRTNGDPRDVAASVPKVIHSVDSAAVVTDVGPMNEIAKASISRSRIQGLTVGSFAIVGLILSALGIYGVMSCAVAQRSHDHGIRLALGARPAQLMSTVLRQGIVVTTVGLGLGIAGALALTRLIESRLFGVKPHDPFTYVTVALLLLAVAMTAAYLPARRAARVDPMTSLRAE